MKSIISRMALSYREQVENSEGAIKENQMENLSYQISLSNVKTSAEKMKKGIDEITNAIENAHNITYEKKMLTDEMKVKLSERKDEMNRLQDELENTRKQVDLDTRKVSELKIESNKIKIAIEKIKEIGRNLDQKYLEQSQNDLINILVKITSDVEKAQSDLNVTKKIEEITFKKLEGIEIDFNRLKLYTLNKISETEKIISNVVIATERIVESYDEITIISKKLLKSAIDTSNENKNYELEQNFTDVKVLI